MNVQEIREKRAELLTNARTIVDTNPELSDDQGAEVDRILGEADTLEKQIVSRQRTDKLATMLESGKAPQVRVSTQPSDREAFSAWAKQGQFCSSAQMNSADFFGIDPTSNSISLRDLVKGTPSAGGYTVPDTLSSAYIVKQTFISPLLGAVGSFNTPAGEDFSYPRVDDDSNMAEYKAELGTVSETPDPVFDKVTFKSWDYFSPIVKVSNQLLRDSVIDIPGLLFNDLFPKRHARKMEAAIVSTNAGTSAPEGILHGVTAGVNLATGNDITLDSLFELEESLNYAYRDGATFVMSSASWAAIRQLTDTLGRPLIQMDLQGTVNKQLLGYPVVICNTLDTPSSASDNEVLILFGQLNGYKVRRVASPVVSRIDQLYVRTGEVGFLLSQAWDARWVDFSSVCVVSLNAHHASSMMASMELEPLIPQSTKDAVKATREAKK